MRQPRRHDQPPPVRVGAMQRPRDVCPGRVPVHILGPGGAVAIESDVDEPLLRWLEGQARQTGISIERALEIVLRRAIEQGGKKPRGEQ